MTSPTTSFAKSLKAICAAAPAIRTSSPRSPPAPRQWPNLTSLKVRSRLIDFIATAIRKFSMYEFKYHRPATVRQAANLLVKNEDAKVIAGGHTLVPVMKQRLASPPHLVDLSHIEGLDAIEMKGRSLVIGATAKHAAVASSAVVGEAIPALAELAGMIGDPAVRHRGTIGGSLAN